MPVASVLTLAEGLGVIHAAGVVHRDMKPSNVLMASDGPRIIDFGISRAADAAWLTHAGRVVGSPGFMSPEQAAHGRRAVDHAGEQRGGGPGPEWLLARGGGCRGQLGR